MVDKARQDSYLFTSVTYFLALVLYQNYQQIEFDRQLTELLKMVRDNKKGGGKIPVKSKETTRRKEPEPEPEPYEPDEKQNLSEIENAIEELRHRGKNEPDLDFNKELRKILDHISDVKGEPRRPITGKPEAPKKKRNVVADDISEEEEDDEDEQQKEEDEEEDDPDKEAKELVNKRLTTCMMLALSFESRETYPRDFYEKLSESKKIEEITAPFTREEMRLFNQLIKEKRAVAIERVNDVSWPN